MSQPSKEPESKFDSKLSWSDHVNKTINKAKKTYHAINLIRKYFKPKIQRFGLETMRPSKHKQWDPQKNRRRIPETFENGD